jgi:WD40 repeat protein
MLLRVGSRIEVLTAGSKTPSILSTRIGVYDVSASGSLVATMGTQEASGTYRQSRVVLVDAFSGATVELQQAQPDQGYAGPIRWSPDAESFTYNLVTWASAPDSGLPGEPTSEDLCVYSVSSKSARCFPQVGLVLAAAWTPAGDLLIAGDPSSGLRLLNPADGSIKDLVVPGISDAAIRDAAAARLGSAPTQLQYADVAVSASGGYYSAVVLARDGGRMLGYVPVILASDGTFMSSGRDNPDLIYEAWSPTQDVLAYSRGFFGEPQSGAPPGAVRVLSPDSTDDVLLSLATVPNSPGTSDPFVLDLLWSPSGRWLAVGGRDEVWIVPSTGATPDSAIRIGTAGGAEEGSILAWIPK